MKHQQLIRLGGASLVFGAVLSVIATLISAMAFPGQDPSPYASNGLFVPVALVGVLGTVLLMLGLPGMYSRSAQGLGIAGLAGIVLIFITGLIFGVFLNLLSALLIPYLSTQAPNVLKGSGPPAFGPFFIIGTLIELVGTVLLAIPFLRGRVLPRWLGYALVASAVLAVIGFVVSGPNGTSNAITGLISSAGALLLFVVLGWIGYVSWQEPMLAEPHQEGGLRPAT